MCSMSNVSLLINGLRHDEKVQSESNLNEGSKGREGRSQICFTHMSREGRNTSLRRLGVVVVEQGRYEGHDPGASAYLVVWN